MTTLQPYSLEYIQQIINDDNKTSTTKITDITTYVKQYMYPVMQPVGAMFYYPHKDAYVHYNPQELTQILKKSMCLRYLQEGKIAKWTLYDCYTQSTDLYDVTVAPHKPRVFEENGVRFVNQCYSLNIDLSVNYEPSQDAKRALDIVLAHLREVLCSNNHSLYQYLIQWLAHSLTRKMRTSLFLRSRQGTGKSIVFDMLQKTILGQNMLITSETTSVCGNFNGELRGRTHLVLEEAPTSSKKESGTSCRRS